MVHRLHELLHWTADWLDACGCCCSKSLPVGLVPFRDSLHLCKVRSPPSLFWRSIFRSLKADALHTVTAGRKRERETGSGVTGTLGDRGRPGWVFFPFLLLF